MAQASVLTDNEIRRVFRIIETTRHANRNRSAFVLSVYAGWRFSTPSICSSSTARTGGRARSRSVRPSSNSSSPRHRPVSDTASTSRAMAQSSSRMPACSALRESSRSIGSPPIGPDRAKPGSRSRTHPPPAFCGSRIGSHARVALPFRVYPSLHQRWLGRAKEVFVGNERQCVARRLLQIDLVAKIAGLGIHLPLRI
jgi:hypothetical protein